MSRDPAERAKARAERRPLRRLWFLGLWLLLPWPLLLFGDAFVPAVRYVLLAGAAAAVAIAEGASGPVVMIVVLFVGMSFATTLACWLIAWVVSRLLTALPRRLAVVLSCSLLAAALVLALVFEPYSTPFGRALTGGLLDVLS